MSSGPHNHGKIYVDILVSSKLKDNISIIIIKLTIEWLQIVRFNLYEICFVGKYIQNNVTIQYAS
jgi:hypothetical protein